MDKDRSEILQELLNTWCYYRSGSSAAVFSVQLNFTEPLSILKLNSWGRIHNWIFCEQNLKGLLDEWMTVKSDGFENNFGSLY